MQGLKAGGRCCPKGGFTDRLYGCLSGKYFSEPVVGNGTSFCPPNSKGATSTLVHAVPSGPEVACRTKPVAVVGQNSNTVRPVRVSPRLGPGAPTRIAPSS